MKHTPTPWKMKKFDNGYSVIRDANGVTLMAGYSPTFYGDIIKCINNHEALVEALIEALPYVEGCLDDGCYKKGAVQPVINRMREVLKAAGVE